MSQRILALGTSPLETAAIALIIAAKFALPLLIIRFPFAAGWANFFLDGVDGDLLIPLGPAERHLPARRQDHRLGHLRGDRRRRRSGTRGRRSG